MHSFSEAILELYPFGQIKIRGSQRFAKNGLKASQIKDLLLLRIQITVCFCGGENDKRTQCRQNSTIIGEPRQGFHHAPGFVLSAARPSSAKFSSLALACSSSHDSSPNAVAARRLQLHEDAQPLHRRWRPVEEAFLPAADQNIP